MGIDGVSNQEVITQKEQEMQIKASSIVNKFKRMISLTLKFFNLILMERLSPQDILINQMIVVVQSFEI